MVGKDIWAKDECVVVAIYTLLCYSLLFPLSSLSPLLVLPSRVLAVSGKSPLPAPSVIAALLSFALALRPRARPILLCTSTPRSHPSTSTSFHPSSSTSLAPGNYHLPTATMSLYPPLPSFTPLTLAPPLISHSPFETRPASNSHPAHPSVG